MIEPIKPEDIVDGKLRQIPDVVMETFNELIAKNFSGGSAVVKQNQVMSTLADKGYTDRRQIFENHWLDVEEIYRKAGWKVSYDKPAYNEYHVDSPEGLKALAPDAKPYMGGKFECDK